MITGQLQFSSELQMRHRPWKAAHDRTVGEQQKCNRRTFDSKTDSPQCILGPTQIKEGGILGLLTEAIERQCFSDKRKSKVG